jgi:TPR repeat protein
MRSFLGALLLFLTGHCLADLPSGMAALRSQDFGVALTEFRAAADQGSAVAQVGMGYLYEHGLGVAQGYADALAWYRKAALQGNGQAMSKIAHLYVLGLGVQDNMIVAVDWMRKAAEAGDAQALSGALLPALPERDQARLTARLAGAQRYFSGKAEGGDITGQLDLGYMYFAGLARERGMRAPPGPALVWFSKAADRGYAGAQVLLASAFESGVAGRADPARARESYEQAANKGNAYAQYSLAAAYAAGPAADPARARGWAQRAAEQGLIPAQVLLGSLLLEGTPADAASGLNWLKRAAAEADGEAQVRLGDECLTGRALPRDYAAAQQWYRRAIDASDSAAAYARLARMHEEGLGMTASDAEAYRLYQRAAQADAEAWVHARLAAMYERGRGTQADPARAFHEYAQAAIGGDRPSMQKLAEVFDKGLLGQVADADKARIWRQRLAAQAQ